ncbi:MAG TPA: tetratricopeptide repeat protein [Candidatus Cloacimonadota bacterium]|nr:tetratricopeptide repeat protein [Candidatus Cloacimonadota bacterium]
MKKLIILLLILISSSLSWAQTQQRTDYAKLLSELDLQAKQGVEDPDLYYNMGVCHYHLNQLALAKLSFLRALRLNSAHKQAQHNVAFIRQLSPDQDLYPEQQFIQRLFYMLYDWFNINRLALGILFFLALSGLCLHWLLRYNPQKEKGLPVLLLSASCLLLLLFIGTTIVKTYRMNHNNKAVIAYDNCLLLEEPDPASNSGRSVSSALMVIAAETSGDYTRIILPDGTGAWVKSDAVLRVVPLKLK